MKSTSFNQGWVFTAGQASGFNALMGVGNPPVCYPVTLPHDAMIRETRRPDTGNGSHTGFYPGNNYVYTKQLQVPAEWRDKDVYLEFEGVFMNAFVYINDDLAANRPYGYSEFHLLANDYLRYGENNHIRVVCSTQMEHTSRWYTGGGMYRGVNLYVAEPVHMAMNGLRVSTPQADRDLAQVQVDMRIENTGRGAQSVQVETQILDHLGQVINKSTMPLTLFSGSQEIVRQHLVVEAPRLWSCETPDLYHCLVEITQDGVMLDSTRVHFGIRTLQLDVKNGLRLNGVPTKLRGACIHHDNGILGAATFPQAEQRRALHLKEAGFNCIRSAHNPLSRAMLNACDTLGILVMDETFDIWTNPKTENDYSNYFSQWWEQDVQAMVDKDFNHPCVVLYSIGNEIQEVGTPRGAQMGRKLANAIRRLDDTRFITNAINGMISVMDQLETILPRLLAEEGIDLQQMAEENADGTGSNMLNTVVSMIGGDIGDKLFSHPLVTQRVEESFAAVDIAGMNYMTGRYLSDQQLYPNRIILGAETFPGDIARLWGLVKRHGHIIGDMTWTGYDYLGEAGVGVFRYDGSPNFGAGWPVRVAGIGDIDLIGDRKPISFLRQVVYGMHTNPYIAVERLDKYNLPVNKTPWMAYDDINSWTWPGMEGKPARVRVFSASEEVELLVNGKSLGRKPAGEAHGFTATFELEYQPGCLVAVSYTQGKETGQAQLQTAGTGLRIVAQADKQRLAQGEEDVAFIHLCLCDDGGIWNSAAQAEITVTVTGAGRLEALGNADPLAMGNYFDNCWPTYDGRLLAVVRSSQAAGELVFCAKAPGCDPVTLVLNCQ